MVTSRPHPTGLLLRVAAVWSAFCIAAAAQPVLPDRVDDLVVDRAGVLSPTEAETLRQKLLAFDGETSTQILVVTLRSLDGADIAQAATELGQAWGVGQAGKDNGAVVLVSIDDRQVFIATGYGLEGAITDAEASRIVRNIIVPNFRQGNFYAGLSGAVDALMEAARGEFSQDEARERSSGGGGVNLIVVILVVIILIFVVSSVRSHGGGGGGGWVDQDEDLDRELRRRKRRRASHGDFPVIIGGGWGRPTGGWGGGGGFGGGGFGGGGFGGFGGGGFGGGGAGGSW